MWSIEDAETERRSPVKPRWRTALGLLELRQRAVFALLTSARIAVGACDLALATAMYLLFLLLQGNTQANRFWWAPRTVLAAAFLAAILIVIRALADIFSARAVFSSIQRLSSEFLQRLTQGYCEMQWQRFVRLNRSELSNHALHTAREAADFYHRAVEMAAALVTIAFMTTAIVYESPIAACTFAGALAVFYLGHRLFIRTRVRQAASTREKSLNKLERYLSDTFVSGKEIRTYGNQAFFLDRICNEAKRLVAAGRSAIFLPQVARIVADQGTVMLFLGVIIAVQLRQGDTHRLLALLAFYFVLSRRLLPLISQMSLIAGQMDSSYENVRIVESELEECRKHRFFPLPANSPAPGVIMDLQQVSFSFHEGAAPILRNIDLKLHEGEIVVLHGASGIGKSSLLNLIAGVSQPVSGVVRVDCGNIAYVPQEVSLLDESIRNNLLFGMPARGDSELMAALAAVGLDEFVAALPLGLETPVGDNGALFSGGERQRLGLARAILRGSRLLLLDEATSALDPRTEDWVLQNLSAAGMAILRATHRTLAHRFARRVYVLEDGCLVEVSQGQIEKDSQPIRLGLSIAKPCRQPQPNLRPPGSSRQA